MKRSTIILAALVIFAFGISAVFADDAPSISGELIKKQLAVKEYQEARADFIEAKADYASARVEWFQARQNYLLKKNQTYASANATTFAIEKGKIFLNRTVNNMISHLQLVKSKVLEIKALSDSERSNITADLDSSILALSALEPEIKAVTTKSQLVAVSQKAKELWHSSQRGVARAAGQIEKNKIDALIKQAENLSVNAQSKIDEAKAKGIETKELESILADYNKHIAEAKASVALAQTQINGKEFDDARESLKNAKEQLREAQQTVREFVKKAREIAKEQRKENRESSSNAPPSLP